MYCWELLTNFKLVQAKRHAFKQNNTPGNGAKSNHSSIYEQSQIDRSRLVGYNHESYLSLSRAASGSFKRHINLDWWTQFAFKTWLSSYVAKSMWLDHSIAVKSSVSFYQYIHLTYVYIWTQLCIKKIHLRKNEYAGAFSHSVTVKWFVFLQRKSRLTDTRASSTKHCEGLNSPKWRWVERLRGQVSVTGVFQ